MNRDTIEGSWKEMKGRIKSRWGKLTDDELDRVEGNYDILCGKIQKAYGLSREEVERDLSQLN
ncbi:MAG TPA: CsbD family protein [Steroidobacteraceae bacterium]|nr:CsbD family protein [Steroidobacteraceae bacterium]